jgi:hypothetical protein
MVKAIKSISVKAVMVIIDVWFTFGRIFPRLLMPLIIRSFLEVLFVSICGSSS